MHIPKTAGMSMRLYLSEQYHVGDICPFLNWHDLLGREREVGSFRLVQGHFRYNLRPLLADDARVLVLLREPLRRTVSALQHLQRDPGFHLDHKLAHSLSLSEMIRHRELMRAQHNVQARYLCASLPADRVSAYLREALPQDPHADAADREAPPTLELARHRLDAIDFVGLTEDLGAVVSSMAQSMNYHPPLYFPFINENPARLNGLRGVSEEDLGILREYNIVDLQIYEYAKRLIERRVFEHYMQRLIGGGVYAVPSGSFEIPMSGVMPGSGWYEPENRNGVCWRWTGPGRHFTIEVPLRDDTSYRLIVSFAGDNPPGPGLIGAEVNDVPVALEPVQGDDRSLSLVIPVGLLAPNLGFCRIRLQGPEPVQVSASDVRALGVAVRQIMFECLDG
ncbi:MAG TPA: hypothetical protein VGM32_07200 [Rhodopila sp.]